MKCEEIEKLLPDYLSGDISASQRQLVEEHLSRCTRCRKALAAYNEAKQYLVFLKDSPVPPDFTEATMIKIKALDTAKSVFRKWLRPALAAGAAVVIFVALMIIQPWGVSTPEASAASIVRNSPEVQAALDGEEIEEVEVTTKVVDDEGNVLVAWVRTETRAVAAEVNLETKKVTEVIPVDVPEFKAGDEQKAIDTAKADSRVRELLAQGAVISEVSLGHSIDIEEVTGPDGVTRKEGAVKVTGTVFIELEGKVWHATVDLDDEKLLGLAKPSTGTIIANMSHLIFSIMTPFVVALGVLIIIGLALRNRLAGKIASVTSIVFGIIGLFGGLYAWPVGQGDQLLALGIPVTGLVMGITEIRRRVTKRWLAITSVVICSLALVLGIVAIIAFLGGPSNIAIAITALALIGIIAYAFYDKTKKVSQKWLRPALGVAAVVIVLAILLITQPWALSPQSIMARAYAATEGLQSYRMSSSLVSIFEGETSEQRSEWEFAFPDRYHGRITLDSEIYEFIIIEEKTYARDPDDASGKLSIGVRSAFAPSKEYTLGILDSLTGLQKLPDEKIEGTDCLHYRGKADVEREIEKQQAKLDPEQPGYEERLKGLDALRTIETEVELWIGKDDFLIRQMKSIMESSVHGNAVVVVKFYDFNEAITIEPPTAESGELLPGWRLQNSPQNQQERTFSSDVSFTTSSDDSVHQQISFRIVITNISDDVVSNVRVSLASMATNEESGWIWNSPSRVTLKPGESEKYHVRWEYDTSQTSKEELARLVNLTTVLATYTTAEGEQPVELLFPDAPYPSKPPPERPPSP